MRNRFFKIFLCISLILTTLSFNIISASAATFYGSYTTVDMRYDVTFNCRMPSNTSYRYCYVLSGSGDDFVWVNSSYMVVWSKDKLVAKDGELVLTDCFYYYHSNSLATIDTILFSDATGVTSLYISNYPSFTYDSLTVVYCNHNYSVDGKLYEASWPRAIGGDLASGLSSFLNSVYVGLSSEGIYLFNTKISFFAMIAGPFVISIGLIILSKIFDVGSGIATHSIRESINRYKQKKSNSKSNSKEGG